MVMSRDLFLYNISGMAKARDFKYYMLVGHVKC